MVWRGRVCVRRRLLQRGQPALPEHLWAAGRLLSERRKVWHHSWQGGHLQVGRSLEMPLNVGLFGFDQFWSVCLRLCIRGFRFSIYQGVLVNVRVSEGLHSAHVGVVLMLFCLSACVLDVAWGRTGGTVGNTVKSMFQNRWLSALPSPLWLAFCFWPLALSCSWPGPWGTVMTRTIQKTHYGKHQQENNSI